MNEPYQYRDRIVPADPKRSLRFGDGRISGVSAVSLGAMCVLAVLAYRYPSYLTTTELRQVYDASQLQLLLKYSMYFSLFLSIVSLVLCKQKWFGVAGLVLIAIAFALGGYTIPIGPVEPRPLSLGVDWLILGFLGSVLVFTSLEKIFPRHKEQVILRPQWGLDLFYFCFNHLAISAILLFANYHTSHFQWAVSPDLQSAVQSMPILVQVALIILAADFVLYWEHRLYHEVKVLWPIHAVHHSVENLDWLAGSRGHFFQVFTERAMVMVPLYLLGPDKSALDIYVTFAALQAVLIHCNVNLSFGPLRNVLVTPQFHHWHHSSEKPAIDTNYAAHTVIWDWLFRTYHVPDERWPAEYGTTVKLPTTFLGQLFYPVTSLLK